MKPTRAKPMACRGLAAVASDARDFVGAAEAGTLPGLFMERARRSPDRRAYVAYDQRHAVWRDFTWRQAAERAACLRSAMQKLDLAKGERVAVLLPNGVDWVAFDMAALGLGLVVVPLYQRDGVDNQAQILTRSGVRLVLVDTTARWARIARSAGSGLAVDQVWITDPTPSPGSAVPLCEILNCVDAPVPRGGPDVAPDDVATLIYTSGTTGPPKGVMLTHAAILWNADAVAKLIAPSPDDLFLSVLPLAHAFERTVGYYLPMMAAATVAHARSAELLRHDFAELRPTVLLAVPRLYERSYGEAVRRAGGRLLGASLLSLARRFGWGRAGERGRAPWLARITGRAVRRSVGEPFLASFGGRLRVAVSGGARLPEALGRTLVGLGLPLVEGYGLTEAGPVVTGTLLGDYLPGSAGRPLAGVQLRLSDQGELLVRSPGLMRGYWRDAQATAAAFEDGWLKTGDLADIRDGRVFIRGRMDDLVVLATGEKFDPEPVEMAILRNPLFEEACVLGDGQPFAVAVLVLEEATWRSLANRLGVRPERPDDQRAKAAVLDRLARALAGFPEFAQVRNVHVAREPWTVETGLLTPTHKVKRHVVRSRYAAAIARLYAEHPAISRDA
jgi:long-chain acyl-CoA synthetase